MNRCKRCGLPFSGAPEICQCRWFRDKPPHPFQAWERNNRCGLCGMLESDRIHATTKEEP